MVRLTQFYKSDLINIENRPDKIEFLVSEINDHKSNLKFCLQIQIKF